MATTANNAAPWYTTSSMYQRSQIMTRQPDHVLIAMRDATDVLHHFTIHIDKLQTSEYFRTCFQAGRWAEGDTRKVTIEDEDIDIFAIYLTWLNEKRFDTTTFHNIYHARNDNTMHDLVVDLYALMTRFLDKSARNALMTAIDSSEAFGFSQDRIWPAEGILRVTNDVGTKRPLWRYMVERGIPNMSYDQFSDET